MKVSIVVPVYNVERYLDECLETVLKLSADFEVILVDDGSTDSSGAMCDAWATKDARFRAVHQSNGGLSAARNTGIRHSTGDYILFLDSDDFLDPQETDRMLEEGMGPGQDVLVGRYRNYYTEGARYEDENCGPMGALSGLIPIDRFLDTMPPDGACFYMTAWRFVISRTFLQANDLYFTTGIYREDEEWTGRIFCAAETVFVSAYSFYQYRQARPGAITGAVSPKHLEDDLRALEYHAALRREQRSGTSRERYLACRMSQLYLDIMLHIYVLDPVTRKRMYADLLRYRTICVPCLSGRIGRTVRFSCNFLGIKATCFLLRIARVLLKHE